MTPAIKFGPCCFCGLDIEDVGPDPCTIQVTTKQDRWQVWKAHGRCFKDRLADLPDMPGLFDPAHF